LFVFDFFYLVNAGDVAATLKLRAQEIFHDHLGLGLAFLGSQAADLGVVVLSGAVGRKNIMALGGADAPYFVGCDTHTDAGPAYQDGPVVFASRHRPGYFFGDIRVIYGVVGIAAEVLDAVAGCFDDGQDEFFKGAAPVVVADCDTHCLAS
jgi:hypothetical protein